MPGMKWVWDSGAWGDLEDLLGPVEEILAIVRRTRSTDGPVDERVRELAEVLRAKRSDLDQRLEFERADPDYAGRREVFDLYAALHEALIQACGVWDDLDDGSVKPSPEARAALAVVWRAIDHTVEAVAHRKDSVDESRASIRAAAAERAAFESLALRETGALWDRLERASREADRSATLAQRMLAS